MAGESKEESRSAPKGAPDLFDSTRPGRNADPFPRPDLASVLLPKTSAEPVVTIAGQRYRRFDNGRAEVLVPAGDLSATPAELAMRRADAERSLYLAGNPLAGAAYGIATMMGASPQARDTAAAIAGGANDALLSAAPLGARARVPTRPPPPRPPRPTIPQAADSYGPLTPSGQSTRLNTTITPSMLGTGTGTKENVIAPGWLGDGNEYNQSRGHLWGAQLGGTANTPREIFTITQNPTNNSDMKKFENQVARRVRRGETVDYFVAPLYESPNSAPSWIMMTAQGSRGDFTPKIIQNPAGRQR